MSVITVMPASAANAQKSKLSIEEVKTRVYITCVQDSYLAKLSKSGREAYCGCFASVVIRQVPPAHYATFLDDGPLPTGVEERVESNMAKECTPKIALDSGQLKNIRRIRIPESEGGDYRLLKAGVSVPEKIFRDGAKIEKEIEGKETLVRLTNGALCSFGSAPFLGLEDSMMDQVLRMTMDNTIALYTHSKETKYESIRKVSINGKNGMLGWMKVGNKVVVKTSAIDTNNMSQFGAACIVTGADKDTLPSKEAIIAATRLAMEIRNGVRFEY